MTLTVPWSVKGVAPDVRETAKGLARRSGMTLGQWLNTLIAEQHGGEAPADPAIFHPYSDTSESPLAAIARRLESPAGDGSPSRQPRAPVNTVSEAVLVRQIRASEARTAALMEKIMRRQEESEAHMAALIDAVVDSFAEKGLASSNQSERASGGSARQHEAGAPDIEQKSGGPQENLRSAGPHDIEMPIVDRLGLEIAALTREVAALRQSVVTAAGQADVKELQADIAALEQRLGEHIGRLAPAERFALIDRKLDLLARQAHDPAVLATIQRETADIRERLSDRGRNGDIGDLLRRVSDLAARFQPLEDAVGDLRREHGDTSCVIREMMLQLGKVVDATQAGSKAGPADDNSALSALEEQVRKLAESLDASAGQGRGAPAVGSALQELLSQSSLGALPEDLQRLFGELRGFQDSQMRDTREALDALRTSLEQLTARLTSIEGVALQGGGTLVSGPPDIHEGPALFGRDRPDDIVWSHELPSSLMGDAPVAAAGSDTQSVPEGGGRPSQVSALGNEARAAFIAAARRAARAAAEAGGSLAAENQRHEDEKPRSFYQRYKRSVLLGLAAVTMMMGALQNDNQRPEHPRGGKAASLSAGAPGAALMQSAGKADAELDSALAGQAGGQEFFRIGLAYDLGRGVERDAASAKAWYQRAADLGSLKAMYNLAVLHATGAVAGQADLEQAAHWFLQAAQAGHAASQYNYALMAARGIGMAPSLTVAYRFLTLAAAQGDKEAAAKRDEIARTTRPEAKAAGET